MLRSIFLYVWLFYFLFYIKFWGLILSLLNIKVLAGVFSMNRKEKVVYKLTWINICSIEVKCSTFSNCCNLRARLENIHYIAKGFQSKLVGHMRTTYSKQVILLSLREMNRYIHGRKWEEKDIWSWETQPAVRQRALTRGNARRSLFWKLPYYQFPL